MNPRSVRLAVLGTSLAVVGPLLQACGLFGDDKLVIYNAQHEQLLEELAPAFEEETGIDVELRHGKDLELSNQLVQEGDASDADVFLTENSPAMSQVEAEGLFAELPSSILETVPEQYRPESGLWTGFVARSTVLVYNTDLVEESELPDSIMDLADPEWAGRLTFSPTGADFQAIVAAILELEGEEATRAWLEGIKENGTVSDNNLVALEAVNSGQSEVGIVYHYYWERDRAEDGDLHGSSAQHYFTDQDPGAFLSVSGAGILDSSDMKEEAEEFVEFLVGEQGQQILAESYALEYPLNPDVTLEQDVKPFAELEPPAVNVSALDSEAVVDMMTEVGFL